MTVAPISTVTLLEFQFENPVASPCAAHTHPSYTLDPQTSENERPVPTPSPLPSPLPSVPIIVSDISQSLMQAEPRLIRGTQLSMNCHHFYPPLFLYHFICFQCHCCHHLLVYFPTSLLWSAQMFAVPANAGSPFLYANEYIPW
jgi:hypothetical protein